MASKKELKEALESMVWQFAYSGVKDDKFCLGTGGLSALEGAFEALGWDDPKLFEDDDSMSGVTCDVEGCVERSTSGGAGWRKAGYWRLCRKHGIAARERKPQPKMKQRAIDKEATRNPITGNLPM